VSGGRRALADALLKHEDKLMNLLSPFGLKAADVQARATLHLSCADMIHCDSDFYVGGRNCIGFVAWAIELQQPIYLVAVGDLKIKIFEPNAVLKEAELKSVTPGTNALVMEFTGDHFNSYRFDRKRTAERAMLEDHDTKRQAKQDDKETNRQAKKQVQQANKVSKRQAKQRIKQQAKRARLAELTENAKKRKKEMAEEKEERAEKKAKADLKKL
jgi:hypothetical protein